MSWTRVDTFNGKHTRRRRGVRNTEFVCVCARVLRTLYIQYAVHIIIYTFVIYTCISVQLFVRTSDFLIYKIPKDEFWKLDFPSSHLFWAYRRTIYWFYYNHTVKHTFSLLVKNVSTGNLALIIKRQERICIAF